MFIAVLERLVDSRMNFLMFGHGVLFLCWQFCSNLCLAIEVFLNGDLLSIEDQGCCSSNQEATSTSKKVWFVTYKASLRYKKV